MNETNVTIEQLETPYIMIDSVKMEHNLRKMADGARERDVALRPHIKTHKQPELAKRQLELGARGITAAKLAEAELMAAAGINDIFVAYPIIGKVRAERAARLAASGLRLIVGVDSIEGAKMLSRAAEAHNITLEIRLEIETGLQRTGVDIDKAVLIAKTIARMNSLKLTGIFTYKGAVLNGQSTTELRAAGHEEGQLMIAAADRLRAAGIAIDEVSVGSTPTAMYAAEIAGITEVRPGTYIFQDRMQAELGVSSLDECAAIVWATVISRPAPDRIIIDGGSKTFATDIQPGKPPLHMKGFGHIVGDPDAVFERMNEEHGVIIIRPETTYAVGDRIMIIPNHICSTINLHNYVIVKQSDGQLHKAAVAARGLLQ